MSQNMSSLSLRSHETQRLHLETHVGISVLSGPVTHTHTPDNPIIIPHLDPAVLCRYRTQWRGLKGGETEERTWGTCFFVWPIISSWTPSSMFFSQSLLPSLSFSSSLSSPHSPSLCSLLSISADYETIRISSTSAQSHNWTHFLHHVFMSFCFLFF